MTVEQSVKCAHFTFHISSIVTAAAGEQSTSGSVQNKLREIIVRHVKPTERTADGDDLSGTALSVVAKRKIKALLANQVTPSTTAKPAIDTASSSAGLISKVPVTPEACLLVYVTVPPTTNNSSLLQALDPEDVSRPKGRSLTTSPVLDKLMHRAERISKAEQMALDAMPPPSASNLLARLSRDLGVSTTRQVSGYESTNATDPRSRLANRRPLTSGLENLQLDNLRGFDVPEPRGGTLYRAFGHFLPQLRAWLTLTMFPPCA